MDLFLCRRFLSLVAPIVFVIVSTTVCSAQILLNGGFESPTTSTYSQGSVTDWIVSGPVTIFSSGFSGQGTTPYGNQYAIIGEGAPASLSQLIAGFVAGHTYYLGVDFANESGSPAAEFSVALTGVTNETQTFNLAASSSYGSSYIPFQSTVLVFTPTTSGSVTVSLSSIPSVNFDSGVDVDNVALYSPAAAPTPEPTTVMEMFLGLAFVGGLILVNRRSRRA